MNPFPVVLSMFRRQRLTLLLFVGLIAFAVALGVALTAQERALRQGSARASDKFDLIVGAPGSPYDLVLASVYLRITSMELLDSEVYQQLLEEPQAQWVAPIAFGDTAQGHPVVGSTVAFVDNLSEGLADGRVFTAMAEAVIGADVEMGIGQFFRSAHGHAGEESGLHDTEIEVVGRMQRTHTPWDRAIVVPVELMWVIHGLPGGHAPQASGEPSAQIGPPFDPDYLTGVPAVVVKPANLAAAYGLRSKYKTEKSQALFPAEILVQLYALMGDARVMLQFLAVGTQALVVAAVLSGLMVIVQLYTSRLATLRALGATRSYVFLVTWTYFTVMIAVGALLGLIIGYGAAQIISAYLSSTTGFTIAATLGWEELQLVLGLLGLGAVLAVIPAFMLFRRPVIADLGS